MTTHVHPLEGCAPQPLAHYLKALGILRLVSEQRDPKARVWWKHETFHLSTRLSQEELVEYFLNDYEPTPILSPWNGGSGFFYDNDPGLSPIERSCAPRFQPFRDGIASAREMSAPLADAISRLKAAEDAAKMAKRKNAPLVKELKVEKERLKAELLATCRRNWSDKLLAWFDAALALKADGSAAWPALLGSGGNDGRLDFTNNSMQHLGLLFDLESPEGRPSREARPWLLAALFATPIHGLLDKAVGQFLPGTAGGDNMSAGFSGKAHVNPWDFVLMLEGAIALSSSITRLGDSASLPQAAAPFAVRPSGAGYPSASFADEGPRGEQWMPLWERPALQAEVQQLFTEGRMRLGRSTSTRAVDAARAVARLGAARGIDAFQRFGFIERNGQANLAVPLGRWQVKSESSLDLLDDVATWLSRIRTVAREERSRGSIVSAARRVDEALLSLSRRPTPESWHWQRVFIALGEAEAALLASPRMAGDPKRRLTPIPLLRPEWVHKTDDGSVEHRLAVALASQDVLMPASERTICLGLRAHWMPLDRGRASRAPHSQKRPAPAFAVDSHGLMHDPDVVCGSHDLVDTNIRLLRRRLILSKRLDTERVLHLSAPAGLGVLGKNGAEASLADVAAFIDGRVDDRKILSLARPLMAVNWAQWQAATMDRSKFPEIDAAYAILRLTHSSAPLRVDGERVPVDPEPLSRLASGDLDSAMAVSIRRLRASGLAPKARFFVADSERARRIAASLAFSISPTDLGHCIAAVIKPSDTEELIHGC